jgi:L-fuconolactonase
MRIDAHQHFWKYSPSEYGWISLAKLRRDFLPLDLKPELERNGFYGSVAVQVRQSLEETRWLLEFAQSAPFILGVVGWVDLRSANGLGNLDAKADGTVSEDRIRLLRSRSPYDRFRLAGMSGGRK